ncbi:MAG: glycine cleavage T C-terminal barrel domain-containing protein [Minwuia sp.]|uniref:glycine cleavage T C-terminal barrel domain-containing protein n=1 Tax=Minwuia sp. TaxID=2493630 RepID=UPI003A88D39A
MSYELPIGARLRKSPFFPQTVAEGVKGFTSYNHMLMPVHYGDPEGEYWRLIDGVSMWDVSVERQVQITGPDAARLTQILVPRDVEKIRIGQGRYAPLSDNQGRLLNDPVLLKLDRDRYWLSLADSDIWLWARGVAYGFGLDVVIDEPDVSPLAIQGPKSFDVAAAIFGDWVRTVPFFAFHETAIDDIPVVVARSGWSHQGGFEIYLKDGSRGGDLWNIVKEAGQPFGIGPGAPNTVERTESGLLSFGTDTYPDANVFEVGLEQFVNLEMDADFVGKTALTRIRAEGPRRRRTGLFIDGPRLPTAEDHWPVFVGNRRVGICTIAVWSPRLKRNIAIALIDNTTAPDAAFRVTTPAGVREAAETSLPFCKPGRS